LTYEVVWNEKVKGDLAPLNKDDIRRIIEAVKERLVQDPIGLGKPLKGEFKGFYRFRVGVYRVIYAVDHAERRLIVLHVKHRKDAYR
jgi:mRNA interferase RelE/StbE